MPRVRGKGEPDLFEPAPKLVEYEVHLHPPKYPAGCFPRRCRHEPQFVLCSDIRCGAGAKPMEIDHMVCMACGMSQPSTYGGNVFVDLHQLWDKLGRHAEIGARLLTIRGKWARIATYLFNEDGWNGRHERVARLIDPNLTMRLVVAETGRGMRLGQVFYDASYLRPVADEGGA